MRYIKVYTKVNTKQGVSFRCSRSYAYFFYLQQIYFQNNDFNLGKAHDDIDYDIECVLNGGEVFSKYTQKIKCNLKKVEIPFALSILQGTLLNWNF